MGPHRDNFAVWPMYRFDVTYRLNESITTCFFRCVFLYLCLLAENSIHWKKINK